MTKLILALSAVTLVILSLLYSAQFQAQPAQQAITPKTYSREVLPTRIPHAKILNASLKGAKYTIIAVEVEATASATLIPNFEEKEYPDAIARLYRCTEAINGGFYTGGNKPLGLFMTGNKTLGLEVKGSVANGFFAQSKLGQRMILSNVPLTLSGYDFILQSGPLLSVGKRYSFIKDSHSRRSLLGVDEENRLYLISVVSADNSYGGPYLSDVSDLFAIEAVQNEIPIVLLLNLDGGSASFFYSTDGKNTFTLNPLAPVGSVICVK